MNRSTWLTSLAVVSLAACSPNIVNGTVAGNGLVVADAALWAQKDSSGNVEAAVLLLSDKPGLCDALKANRQAKNQTYLVLQLFSFNDQAQRLVPGPGDFTVVDTDPTRGGNYATAQFVKTDSACVNTLSPAVSKAKSGLVKVSTLALTASSHGIGTFDATFGTDNVTGAFSTSYCEVPSSMDLNCQ
jgi:hypothetical protein